MTSRGSMSDDVAFFSVYMIIISLVYTRVAQISGYPARYQVVPDLCSTLRRDNKKKSQIGNLDLKGSQKFKISSWGTTRGIFKDGNSTPVDLSPDERLKGVWNT